MALRIETDAYGRDVIWSEVGGKKVPLEVDSLFVRAVNGHIFTSAAPGVRGSMLSRLSPHEVEMVEFWLDKQGVHELNIFDGEPPVS